jgi:hypothetical protein
MKYNRDTVYVVGEARTTKENAITKNYNSFFIGYVIDRKNNEIVDLSCSSILKTTDEFIKSIFIGKSFESYSQELEAEIGARYYGSSRKSVVIAYKDAIKKYLKIK